MSRKRAPALNHPGWQGGTDTFNLLLLKQGEPLTIFFGPFPVSHIGLVAVQDGLLADGISPRLQIINFSLDEKLAKLILPSLPDGRLNGKIARIYGACTPDDRLDCGFNNPSEHLIIKGRHIYMSLKPDHADPSQKWFGVLPWRPVTRVNAGIRPPTRLEEGVA